MNREDFMPEMRLGLTSGSVETTDSGHQSFRLLLGISVCSFLIILTSFHTPSDYLQPCAESLDYWLAAMSGVSCISIISALVQYYLPKETITQFCALALVPITVCCMEICCVMYGVILLQNDLHDCLESYWLTTVLLIVLSIIRLVCLCVYSLLVIIQNCDQCIISLTHLWEENETWICAYCGGSTDLDEECARYPCRHTFHLNCMEARPPLQCPVCSVSFDA